jgi:hypothetical protein
VRRTLRRLCHELKVGCPDINADIPDDPEKLRVAFPDFLRKTCEHNRVVILLDAVNQFDPASHSAGLYWLPEDLPANAHVILSVLAGPALDELRRRSRKPREIELQPLTAADGEAIIEQFRKRYHKKFEPDQRATLLAKTDAGTPLYLLAALEELRTLGTYEEITRRIAELPPKTGELFAWILERLENDDGFRNAAGRQVGRELVSRFAAMLSVSRYGLSHYELAELLAPGNADAEPPIQPDSKGNVAALLHLLCPYLMRRGELLDFYHQQFRETVEVGYLKADSARLAAHGDLAAYFRAKADPAGDSTWLGDYRRGLTELPHHALRSRDLSGVAHLVRTGFLKRKAECLGDADALADAREIAVSLADGGDEYWDSLVRCADIYCGLAERLHSAPRLLETLISRGDVEHALSAIDAEKDGPRKRLLLVAASVLFAEVGNADLASCLRERAMTGLDLKKHD